MKKERIKFFALALGVIVLSISCNKKNVRNELQLTLSNFSTSSYFIAVDITCEKKTFPIIITNDSFFDILFQRGMVKNKKDYTNKLIEKIIKKEAILFDSTDKEMLESYSVIKNDTLNVFLKKNNKDFINKYFENNILKTGEMSFIQEKSIIYYLFYDRMYCRRDCVSGSIMLVLNFPAHHGL